MGQIGAPMVPRGSLSVMRQIVVIVTLFRGHSIFERNDILFECDVTIVIAKPRACL